MANESHLQFGILNVLKENAPAFAEADYLLRTGTHIQNVPHQAIIYRFLFKNESILKTYYQNFFRITLESEGNVQDDEKFYYLSMNQEGDNWGGMRSNRIKKVSDRSLLFAIYLFYLYKIELHFEKKVQKEPFIEQLNADSRIRRLFSSAKQDKDLSDTEFKTIENWAMSALKECTRIGFVYFNEQEPEQFEILPAIWRIGFMYETQIRNITTLFDSITLIK